MWENKKTVSVFHFNPGLLVYMLNHQKHLSPHISGLKQPRDLQFSHCVPYALMHSCAQFSENLARNLEAR